MEKTIDFICFGWHLTKGSIYKDYIGDRGKKIKEYVNAGWYRKKYLIKKFRVKEEVLASFLEENKNSDRNSLREKLYIFIMTHRSNN